MGSGLRRRRSVDLLRAQTRWPKKTRDGEEEAGNSYFPSSLCVVVRCVGASVVWNINTYVTLSVSASSESVVIDIRNVSCLGSVL